MLDKTDKRFSVPWEHSGLSPFFSSQFFITIIIIIIIGIGIDMGVGVGIDALARADRSIAIDIDLVGGKDSRGGSVLHSMTFSVLLFFSCLSFRLVHYHVSIVPFFLFLGGTAMHLSFLVRQRLPSSSNDTINDIMFGVGIGSFHGRTN